MTNENSDVSNFEKLKEEYIKKGYYMGPSLLKSGEVDDLRKSLKNALLKKSSPRDVSLFDIDDYKTIKTILSFIDSDWIQSALKKLGDCFDTPVSILPPFTIMNNYHVNRINDPGIGWHRDCGGEMKYNYCKQRIYNKKYVFGKIGIYLQENLDYGGAIDVIPSSHKYLKSERNIARKISYIPLKIIQLLQSKFPKSYETFPENFYMKIYKGKKILTQKGQAVLFDSRIFHRGSPVNDSVRKNILFSDDTHQAKTPEDKTKYAIYCHFGSSTASDSYIYSRIKSNNNSSELKRWIKEQKNLEKFSSKLSISVKNIIDPILPNFNEYL